MLLTVVTSWTGLAGRTPVAGGEEKSMVRILQSRPASLISNSPVQVDAQTCTRPLAFREIFGICATKDQRRLSLLQVRAAIVQGMPPNAIILALGLVSSLTIKTCWRRTQSRANPSLGKFPGNSEKYREFCQICGVAITEVGL